MLPIRPTRLILSPDFFNQHQKFLIAGRAEQGGFNHIAPAKASLCGNKLAKFLEDAFMDRQAEALAKARPGSIVAREGMTLTP